MPAPLCGLASVSLKGKLSRDASALVPPLPSPSAGAELRPSGSRNNPPVPCRRRPPPQGTMNEEQFVSIDLDDDNICSVCKLGTEKETLSFCHVCFELNIEGKVGAGAILGRPAGG